MTDDTAGVWVAHFYDGSDTWVFATEVDALRHALTNGANVTFVRYGESLGDAAARAWLADGSDTTSRTRTATNTR